jgi:serine protease AprX
MAKVRVLLEKRELALNAFGSFRAAAKTPAAFGDLINTSFAELRELGVRILSSAPPVPMFDVSDSIAFTTLAASGGRFDMSSTSVVVPAEVDEEQIARIKDRGFLVWPDAEMRLTAADCAPFTPAVDIDRIRAELGVSDVFSQGYVGEGCIVAIIDEGVNKYYPVIGGANLPTAGTPGAAPIGSHGSMCAADVLVAAPGARLLDYPLLNVVRTSDQIAMLQEILNERRTTGRPHIANNSYGFYEIAPGDPNHPAINANHPFNRKVSELVAAGIVCFFAAGNCGPDCPAGNCHPSAIGASRSISGANSLAEVITIAAVNASGQRIGYSAIGPGIIAQAKPDFACYSHFFGNFGPERPAGGDLSTYDNGTSAATPTAAGVAALLWSRNKLLTPSGMFAALKAGVVSAPPTGFDYNIGHGIIHAGRSFATL